MLDNYLLNGKLFLENIYYPLITMKKVNTLRHTRKDDKALLLLRSTTQTLEKGSFHSSLTC